MLAPIHSQAQRATSPASRPATAAPREGAPEHSVQVDTLGMADVWEAGFTGKGVGIAVIDTGVALHPDIKDRVVAFKDFVNHQDAGESADPSAAYDDGGHGTAVSTVSAGDGTASQGRNMGTAPGANIIGLKGVEGRGYAWASNVVNSIQWAIENKERYNIRVLNMSFFLDDPSVEAHGPVVQAIEKAAEAGIIPVAAACNDGPSAQTLHTIASYPFVVTVAAFSDHGTVDAKDDRIANFSSRGPGDHGEMKPDVAAPGVRVIVGTTDGDYEQSDGTSFASPIAAGVIATWLEANPGLKVEDVQKIISTTSEPLAGYSHFDQGFGEIRPMAGLQMALSMKEQPKPTA